jgi:hypothetical protein
MRKKFLLILLVPVILILGLIAFMWLTPDSEEVSAQLIIKHGDVRIKHEGKSWTNAQNGMLLHQHDTVKTGDNTSASIVLFKSSIIRLDSNTEVTITKLLQQAEGTSVKIKQDIGKTWHNILNISGIENYDVQTPTTIASLRGTSFVIIVYEDGKTYKGVARGTINVTKIKNGEAIEKIEVKKDEAVSVSPDELEKPFELKPFEKDEWVLENQKEDGENVKKVKEDLYQRIDPYIPELKERYGVTDEELDALIDGYLLGYYDLPPETPNWIRELVELS